MVLGGITMCNFEMVQILYPKKNPNFTAAWFCFLGGGVYQTPGFSWKPWFASGASGAAKIHPAIILILPAIKYIQDSLIVDPLKH